MKFQQDHVIPAAVKIRLRDEFVSCPGCNVSFEALQEKHAGLYGEAVIERMITIDHLIPVAEGGTADQENLVAVCSHCNHLKGKQYPWDWNGQFAGLPAVKRIKDLKVALASAAAALCFGAPYVGRLQ